MDFNATHFSVGSPPEKCQCLIIKNSLFGGYAGSFLPIYMV